MQGKEVPERKTETDCNVGIDVCKSWSDVHVLPAGESLRVANTRQGIASLKRWLRRFEVALVAVEATGKWHRALHRSLHAAGLRVAVVDPFRVRMFARAQGIVAKTDRLDARVLAVFAAVMDPPTRPPAAWEVEALQELVRGRNQRGRRADLPSEPACGGPDHLPAPPARPPHQTAHEGCRRPRCRDQVPHRGRAGPRTALPHRHLDPRHRTYQRRHAGRLSARTRRRLSQADRPAGRPRPHTRRQR